ncbi:hypothetical protein ACKAE7_06570 [Pseudarthrobacter sp. NKDBFgelt]
MVSLISTSCLQWWCLYPAEPASPSPSSGSRAWRAYVDNPAQYLPVEEKWVGGALVTVPALRAM